MSFAEELQGLSREAKAELAARMQAIAERFGADPECQGCDKVIRKIANGRDEGHACLCSPPKRLRDRHAASEVGK